MPGRKSYNPRVCHEMVLVMKIQGIMPVAALIIAVVSVLGGCGDSGNDNDIAGDVVPGDVVHDDTLTIEDTAGIDTSMPEVVLSEEERAVYARHAELVVESADMTYEGLAAAWYEREGYLAQMPFDVTQADFLAEVTAAYGLDQAALAKLAQNGFVVLDNGSATTHPNLYMDIYVKDLPVLVTADSIMFAVHKSYDEMLKQLEEAVLIDKLGVILEGNMTGLAAVCAGASGMALDACRDVDAYLTIARTLLSGEVAAPQYAENAGFRDDILALVEGLQPVQIVMFGRPYPSPLGRYDFSQFKPRGHYTETEELQRYFKAMIWLGRTPMNLTMYGRDLVASVVLLKALREGGQMDNWQKLDHAIQVFVGKSDNLTPPQFVDVLDELAIDTDISTLADRAETVMNALALHGIPGSRILSQIMMMDPMSAESTPIPAEFQLLGQRFVIDSYVFSNVVYDRITWEGDKPMRLMPDPLDAAFVLGFDESLPLLKDEIDTWHYAGNLNVMRSMVEDYEVDFWAESMYNAWLDGIRALGVDQTGEQYPAAARTLAWAHRNMQTGLASWAELRHDTILYVKQSYTGEGCDYPDGYVEPNPEFFRRMKDFAVASNGMLSSLTIADEGWPTGSASYWFGKLAEDCDMLAGIAQAQLDKTARTSEQTEFLKTTVVLDGMCGGPGFSGWYAELFYGAHTETFKFKPTVCDVHTDPNSTEVLHVATGGANPMVMAVQLDGGPRIFVGPVSSYYQFREPGFVRLTDEEWLTRYSGLDGFVERPGWTASFVSAAPDPSVDDGCE